MKTSLAAPEKLYDLDENSQARPFLSLEEASELLSCNKNLLLRLASIGLINIFIRIPCGYASQVRKKHEATRSLFSSLDTDPNSLPALLLLKPFHCHRLRKKGVCLVARFPEMLTSRAFQVPTRRPTYQDFLSKDQTLCVTRRVVSKVPPFKFLYLLDKNDPTEYWQLTKADEASSGKNCSVQINLDDLLLSEINVRKILESEELLSVRKRTKKLGKKPWPHSNSVDSRSGNECSLVPETPGNTATQRRDILVRVARREVENLRSRLLQAGVDPDLPRNRISIPTLAATINDLSNTEELRRIPGHSISPRWVEKILREEFPELKRQPKSHRP